MTTVIRVVVVDDEPLVRERVRDLVLATPGLELVGVAANGLEALDLIRTVGPDVLFLDVEMPELSGLGVIAALDDGDVPVIVFITAHERYALAAFEVGAVDYLHKPVTRQRFAAAAERARERVQDRSARSRRQVVMGAAAAERERGHRRRYVVRQGQTHRVVPVEAIDWIDAADNYLRLHVGGRTLLARGTMRSAAEELDPSRFMRVHRSAIVAIDRIARVSRTTAGQPVVELADGTRLRCSRAHAAALRGIG